MSVRAGDDAPYGGHEAEPSEATRGTWKSTWSNNKGLIFITLAQAIASSMDAIVRFLQQGEHKMHPFQVRSSPLFHFRVMSRRREDSH